MGANLGHDLGPEPEGPSGYLWCRTCNGRFSAAQAQFAHHCPTRALTVVRFYEQVLSDIASSDGHLSATPQRLAQSALERMEQPPAPRGPEGA